MSDRTAAVERRTRETEVKVTLNLDGSGAWKGETGIGFLDHMLELFACHGGLDLALHCRGDLHVDPHHSAEDSGITLGQALTAALGDKRDIARYGSAYVPMDEALARAVIDLSGRPQFVYRVPPRDGRMGEFPFELLEEFWRALCVHGKMNLHIELLYGSNLHHIAEAQFKSVARALRCAVARIPGSGRIPSTKGDLQ